MKQRYEDRISELEQEVETMATKQRALQQQVQQSRQQQQPTAAVSGGASSADVATEVRQPFFLLLNSGGGGGFFLTYKDLGGKSFIPHVQIFVVFLSGDHFAHTSSTF